MSGDQAPVQPEPLIPAEVQRSADQLLLISALIKVLCEERDRGRIVVADRLAAGVRITTRDPRDGETRTGTVGMTDPDKVAEVTDPEAFSAWVAARWPGRVGRRTVFGDPAQVAAVLAEHAPHLLVESVVISDVLREEALAVAVTEKVPGTAVMRQPPRLYVRPGLGAREVVAAALAGDVSVLEIGAGR